MQEPTNILVCVTKQVTCEALIREGNKVRNNYPSGELFVLHVAKEGIVETDNNLSHLFEVSSRYNAMMSVMVHQNPIKAIQEYVKKHGITHVVLGETRHQNPFKSTMHKLQHAFGMDVEVVVVPVQESFHYEDVI